MVGVKITAGNAHTEIVMPGSGYQSKSVDDGIYRFFEVHNG
jgi:hypothetical protein